ncbi:unnamed protein product [Rotaria sp. Silwood1]|nr:unnamed protein product [Rotaria sp. Silwood1]
MRIIDIDVGLTLNPKMKQVHFKLLLCLLLAIGATGQYNLVNPWNLGFTGQQLALGQPGMGDWNGFSGMGPYGRFVQQPAIAPQVSVGLGQVNPAQQIYQPAITQQAQVTNTELTNGNSLVSSVPDVFASANRGDKQRVCYNIIDMVYPLFSMYCSVLPQTAFSLPNFFGHETKEEVHELFVGLTPAIRSGCSSYVRLFLCPLFFPPCNVKPILPCADLCRTMQHRCGAYGLSGINCDQLPEKSEFCQTIIDPNRFIDGIYGFHGSTTQNQHGSQYTDSNNNVDLSLIPSTSGTSSNETVQTETKTNTYYGENISSIGSDESIVNIQSTQTPKVMPSTSDLSRTNTDDANNQHWTNVDSSRTSLSTGGGSFHSTNNFMKPSSSSSELNNIASVRDSSFINNGASAYMPNNNVRLAYTNNENYGDRSSNSDTAKLTDSSSIGNNNKYVSGSSHSSNTVSTDSSMFGRNDNRDESLSISNAKNYVGSKFSDGGSSLGDASRFTSSSSYDKDKKFGGEMKFSGGESSLGDTSRFSSSSLYGKDYKYSGEMKPAGGESFVGDANRFSSSSLYGKDSKYSGEMKPTGGESSLGDASRFSSSSLYGKDYKYSGEMKPAGGETFLGDASRLSSSSLYGKDSKYSGEMKPTGGESFVGDASRFSSSSLYGKDNKYSGEMKPTGGESFSGDAGRFTSSSLYGKDNKYSGEMKSSGGESSLGDTSRFTSSTLYGKDKKSGRESTTFGSSMKSSGSTSHGSSDSYSGSSYGKINSHGLTNEFTQSGLPYGLQSTAEYPTYYTEKLDLSKCGPQPPKNPCTINGPQLYPIPGYPHCYIQCALEHMFVKPCPPDLVWNTHINVCDWPTVPYSSDGNSHDSSSHSTGNYQSVSSYSYGRKKRSTIDRKKLFRNGNPFPSLTKMDVPLGPPVPGIVPLPGFSGPIGIAGPLVPPPTPPASPPSAVPGMLPQMTSRMLPVMFPPFIPMPTPMFPPQMNSPPMFQPQIVHQPVFSQPSAPQQMFSQPSVPQQTFPQPSAAQQMLPQLTVPQLMFPQPVVLQRMFPQPRVIQPVLPPPQPQPQTPAPTPTLPPFIPPIFPTLPIPMDGPLLPPLPMKIPATFIPGPVPIFGAPWFGPFDEPARPAAASSKSFGSPSTPFGQPFGFNPSMGYPFGFNPSMGYPFGFDFGFAGGFPSASNFYGGFPQQFRFPYGYDNYRKQGGKGGNKQDYDDDDDEYDTDDDDEKPSASNGDDSDNSKSSKNRKNNAAKDHDDDLLKRKKREYHLNDDQDKSLSETNEQQSSLTSINQPFNQESLCIGKTIKSNIPHPTDSTKYILCLNENKYEIMDCPTDFIYNALIDQCEKNKNIQSICEQEQPCLNDGQCYSTSLTTYKCICQGAWTGERCETPLSSCALNPCGDGNQCHSLITNDYKQDYICICNQQQSYGLTCEQNTVPNPCIGVSNNEEQYYPFAFSTHAYIQCDSSLIHIRPCANDLYWNQESKTCDHEKTSPINSIDNQSQPYQMNYNTQQTETIYKRPLANFFDQMVDKQQRYRYRNYYPHIKTNDLRYNQMHITKEKPMIYSFFPSSSSMINDNRGFKNEDDYTPVNTYVILEDQTPMLSDEQFSQSYNQLPTNSFMQSTPQRNKFRVFQPSSSRIINSLNTEPTSSSYRR